MPATRDDVLKSAMELSETDRLFLATELMDTVSDDFPGLSIEARELPAELESRASDGSPGISWEQIQAQLRADLCS